MALERKPSSTETPRLPPATTLESREDQLISLAVDLAEKQIREGTASSQVVTHFLKLGTTREKLEQEKIAYENELLKARKDALESQVSSEGLLREALAAFSSYTGTPDEESEEEDY